MIETAMQMNPRVTFDFISVGAGNIGELAAKIKAPTDAQKPGVLTIAGHEQLGATVMNVLQARFAGQVPVEAPKPEAPPKAEASKQQQAQPGHPAP
jgi:hypothetical protein